MRSVEMRTAGWRRLKSGSGGCHYVSLVVFLLQLEPKLYQGWDFDLLYSLLYFLYLAHAWCSINIFRMKEYQLF